MGSPRGRSIRLRIYFLVAIPLVMMLAVLGTIGVQSVQNYQNVKRAPQLILSTAEQSAFFFLNIIAERRAAVVYLSDPTPANLSAYQQTVNTTKAKLAAFDAQMVSPAVTSAEDSAEKAGIAKAINDLGNMGQLRLGVEARKVTPFLAWEGYTKIMQDQPAIFEAEASSFSNATSLKESFGLIQVVLIREDASEMDSLLAAGLAAGNMTPAERDAFSQAYGRLVDQENTFPALLNKAEQAAYYKDISPPQIKQDNAEIIKISDAIAGGVPLSQIKAMGVTPQLWQQLTSAWGNASFQGGVDAAAQHLIVDQNIANSARNRLIAAAAAGGAALILTLIVTLLLARSVNRRLTLLRRNAVVLATEHLPNVVARLRRGEQVDIAASAPALRVGSDEIGQVGQAFDMVRQTALRSAVEESRLRQGVNDMFRNLARRNQSLLQRQLTMLDGMERRATDPDVLDDLFKMDHLTTRMRRHAEGLIILSGAAPGRGWSTPVKLIDVMRGAVAEVEDFARVIVTTQSRAALTGGAVTDVIHLLAELIENATTLSPPFTQVRVHGEMVANGFAIEIEDRGLGMTPMRMGELNERLANPPDVNPANTEQLGLFVVGQLARRHSINVALRPSPYGGTTAIVMIPQRLVVDDSTPAIGTGTGPQAAVQTGPQPALAGRPGGGGMPVPGGFPGAPAPGGAHTPSAGFPRAGFGSGGPRAGSGFGEPGAPDSSGGHGGPPDLDSIPLSSPFANQAPSPNGAGGGTGGGFGGGHGGPGGQSMSGNSVLTGVPLGRPASQPPMGGASQSQGYSSSSFYGNGNGNAAPGNRAPAGQNGPGTGPFPGPGGPGGIPNTGPNSYGSNFPDSPNGHGHNAGSSNGYESTDRGSSETDAFKGLPRRVRQANLAPQLRKSEGGTGAPQGQAPAKNPADVKNTFSAMQRGWQQGRSQNLRDNGGH